MRKNCTAASRDLSILSAMLPLMSKITPMETGVSSLEKSHDFLLDAVLKYAEVFLFEAGDQAPDGIGDGNVHERQLRFGL